MPFIKNGGKVDMSNLGKIYEVDFINAVKNAYPIVYENADYYVCKKHGSTQLLTFYKKSPMYSSKIYSIEKFNEIIFNSKEKLSYSKFYVYEPPHTHFYFDSCGYKTREALALLEKRRKTLLTAKTNHEFRLKQLNSEKCNVERLLNEIVLELAELENKIPELEQKIKNMEEENN